MIGLVQADRSREPSGGWVWVTGEPVGFRKRERHQPDNHKVHQHNAGFYGSKALGKRGVGPVYRDDNSWTSNNCIIEIE